MEGDDAPSGGGVEWELCKENIQPLKQGRKVSKLNNILQPRDEEAKKSILEERQRFETELRTYSGEDPLDPWYRYIAWVEQTYPKGGKEGNVHVLIQKCITKFKDDKGVQDDVRFLDIWLKYAAISSQPLEVYDFMFKQGLCSQQGGLYEAWAWQLERASSYKKAEAVFIKGLGALTDPEAKELLSRKQKQFQARVIRRMKGEQIPEAEVEEEQRSTLGLLRAHGRHGKVASVRVGQAKLGGPGVLPTKQPLKQNNGQKGGFAIFQDENSAPVAAVVGPGVSRGLPGSSKERKENEMSAGQWSKAKGVSRGSNVPINKISQQSQPAFTVHQDENLAQPSMTPRKLVAGETNVLSTRKEKEEGAGTVHCPIALFEAPDPTKRPMYCKDKVYQGATEFSFEELRAARWKVKENSRLEIESIETKRKELVEMEAKLKEQQESMARQMAEFQKMLAGGTSALMQQQQAASGVQQGAPGVLLTRPSISDSEMTSGQQSTDSSFQPQPSEPRSVSGYPSLSKKVSMDDTTALITANPTGARTRPLTTPSPLQKTGHHVSLPSPTVNTKEAMAMMQELWSNSVGGESPLAQTVPPPPSSEFQIFSDPAPSSAPFTIFCDNSAQQAGPGKPVLANRKSRAALFNQQDDKENSPEVHIVRDQDAENQPPVGYSQPQRGSRPMSGILTQADNVEFVPLEEQELMLDEDEMKQEEEFRVPTLAKPQMGNQTMALPNEDEFKRLAKFNSTPSIGKPFMCDNDENTCAVDIVYRNMGPGQDVGFQRPSLSKPQINNHTMALPNEDDFERMAKTSSTPFTGRPFMSENDENTCAIDIVYRNMGPPSIPSHTESSQPGLQLSPIVETSREYRSSSSSSGGETLGKSHLGKSRWGNTVVSCTSTTHCTTSQSLARTPGHSLAALSSASGYMGDKSSMSNVTKSGVKEKIVPYSQRQQMVEDEEDEPTGMFSDMMAEFKQNLAVPVNKPDAGLLETSLQASFVDPGQREMTGVDFRQETTEHRSRGPTFNMTGAPPTLNMTGAPPTLNMTGAPPTLNMTGAPQTLHMTGVPPTLNMTGAPPILNMTGAPTLNMTGAPPTLNMTGAPSKLNSTGAPPTLNMTGAPDASMQASFVNHGRRDMTGMDFRPETTGLGAQGPSLNITGAPPIFNMTGAPPNFNMTGAQPTLDLTGAPALDVTGPTGAPPVLNLSGLRSPVVGSTQNDVHEVANPFSEETHAQLLASLPQPLSTVHGYISSNTKLPQVKPRSFVTLGEDVFSVSELKGEGGFAKVFAATKQDNGLDSTIAGIDAVLKVQKPANDWEWYICREVRRRIEPSMQEAFMSSPRNYNFIDGGIFVSYHQKFGSLLDIVNVIRNSGVQKSCMEPMAMYFAIEILGMVEALHKANVIHADIKADNFLLQNIPVPDLNAGSVEEMFQNQPLSLQLIDFGKAIDLKLFPARTMFSAVVKTEGLCSTEMREGKLWREHLDYFGLAATVYTLLFGDYMDVVKVGDRWEVKGSFKRWWQVDLWREFFTDFVNIQGTTYPDLTWWRKRFQQVFFDKKMAKNFEQLRKDVGKAMAARE